MNNPTGALLLALLLAFSSPGAAQTSDPSSEPVEGDLSFRHLLPADFPADQFSPEALVMYFDPEDVPEHLQPRAVLRGADVPYGTRVKSLFSALGAIAVRDREAASGTTPGETALLTLGLDPQSAAAWDLVGIALGYRVEYHASLEERNSLPIERQREIERSFYRKAGSLFGEWLRARAAEQWVIEPLLDRLLNGPFSGISLASTDQTQEGFEELIDGYEAAFSAGLLEHLDRLPRRFR